MTLTIRRSESRGQADHGWLLARHSFSFGQYHDPEHIGFRDLLVINEDRIQPGRGFPTHGHQDMEILTYVLEGALEHKDSMGNGSQIRPGEVQRMTAGTGVQHSEYNASQEEELHLLQIWIRPGESGLEPGYEQSQLDLDSRIGELVPVARPNGGNGTLTLHQDVSVHAARLRPGDRVTASLDQGRHAWLQVIRGRLQVADASLAEGDGAAISDVSELSLRAVLDCELLLFDLR